MIPLLAVAAPAMAEPRAEAVGAAFARVVGLPGEVSLAAGLVGAGEPRFFLTEKAERPLLTAEGPRSPAELVRQLGTVRQSGKKEALKRLAGNECPGRNASQGYRYFGCESGSVPGAVSVSYLLRNRAGRWIALAIVWNGETAEQGALAAAVEPLLRLMRKG